MKLIPLDAVLAIIEKKLSYYKDLEDREIISDCGIAGYRVVKILKYNIESLEVKEVDLDYIRKELDELIRFNKPDGDFGWGTLYNVATHFFELGLKAQKGE